MSQRMGSFLRSVTWSSAVPRAVVSTKSQPQRMTSTSWKSVPSMRDAKRKVPPASTSPTLIVHLVASIATRQWPRFVPAGSCAAT